MNISPEGLDAIKSREGCRLTVYPDSGGKPTIGWGHLLTTDEADTGLLHGQSWREGISQELADAVLLADLASTERGVTDAVQVPLVQYQFDALVSFAFNVGLGRFRGSTLLKRLNEQDYTGVPDELRLWNHVNKQVDRGLTMRREAEIQQWENA